MTYRPSATLNSFVARVPDKKRALWAASKEGMLRRCNVQMVTKNNGALYDWKICGNLGGRPLITLLFVEGICHDLQPFRFAREDTRLYTGRISIQFVRVRHILVEAAVLSRRPGYNITSQVLWSVFAPVPWSEQATNLSQVPSVWLISRHRQRRQEIPFWPPPCRNRFGNR